MWKMLTRKMKDSGIKWIGEIPEDWEIRKLKYTLEERKEKNNPIVTDNILSLSVERGIFPYAEKTGGGNKSKADLTAYKVAHPNDIVINSMNILAGAVGLSRYTGVVSPVYYTLYTTSEEINITYYYYLFRTREFQRSLLGLGNGIMMRESSTGKLNTIRMRIPMDKLAGLFLPLPPRRVQDLIVKSLAKDIKVVNKLINQTEQSIKELKNYKQSLITESVTKGIDPNVEMKDSGVEWIGAIPSRWGLNQIKTVAKVMNGKEIENDGGHIPVFGSGGVFKYTNTKLYDRESVLFGRKGTIGKPLIVNQPFWTVDTMFYTHIFENRAFPKWLYYILISLPWDVYSTQTAIPSIVGSEIESIRIPVPAIEEQQQIVEYLDDKVTTIDRLIEDKTKVIEELENYKKSLIYEYVTGKKEV